MLYNIFSSVTLFRFINFGAFILFFGYLFKRYMLPSIKQQIQEKNLLIQNLEHQKQGIKYQHNNLDNALEQQDYLAASLTQKIAVWNDKVIELDAQELHEQKAILKTMQQNELIQSHEQARTKLNQETVPRVLMHVEKDLHDYFSNPHHNQDFIKDIISFLQERSS